MTPVTNADKLKPSNTFFLIVRAMQSLSGSNSDAFYNTARVSLESSCFYKNKSFICTLQAIPIFTKEENEEAMEILQELKQLIYRSRMDKRQVYDPMQDQCPHQEKHTVNC